MLTRVENHPGGVAVLVPEVLGRVDSRFLSASKGFGASATGWTATPNRSWPKTPPKTLGMMRIYCPHDLATKAGIRGGEPAEIEVAGGRLVVLAAPLGMGTLADLLAKVTPDNLHGEWAAGPPAGAELL